MREKKTMYYLGNRFTDEEKIENSSDLSSIDIAIHQFSSKLDEWNFKFSSGLFEAKLNILPGSIVNITIRCS